MGRLKLTCVDKAPVFRKIAMGTWNKGGDPSVYGLVEIDMSNANKFMEEYSAKHGVKVTPTHLVGKAIAHCMKIRPELNGMIRGHRIYLREDVDLFYQVNIPGVGADGIKKANLSGCTVHQADTKSLKDIAMTLQSRSEEVRNNKDTVLAKSLDMFKWMPWWAAGFALWLSSFLTYGLNLNLQFLGIPRDPFGSVMITSVGSMGIDVAWAPLVPYSRVPLLLAIGSIRDMPLVKDGALAVAPIMRIGVTFDHRFIDGVHAAHMSREFKLCFEDPWKYLA